MFVSTESLGEIQKLHFLTIRSYLLWVANPKGLRFQSQTVCSTLRWVPPHTKHFSMHKKKNFVADSQHAVPTPEAQKRHNKNLYKTIENFFELANASEFIEVNNEMIDTFLEKGLDKKQGYQSKHLLKIVFMVNFQSKFLTALKENWETLKTLKPSNL